MGTTNGDNLGGSSYLSPFIAIGLTSTWFVWYISRYATLFIYFTWVPPYIIFSLQDMPTLHKYHRSLIDLLYSSMDGVPLPKSTIWYLIDSGVTQGCHFHFFKKHPMCSPHLSFYLHYFSTSEPIWYPCATDYTSLYL